MTGPLDPRRIWIGTIESERVHGKERSISGQRAFPEKRRAAEELLGVALGEDEVVLIRTSKDRILKPALTGQARNDAFAGLAHFQQEMQRRVEGVPEAELEAAIDEAVEFVRHNGR